MNDLIRREDAIKALRWEYPTMPMFKSLREEWAIKIEGFRKAEEVIMSIPSADRPQGEWTNAGVLTVRCSNCKSDFHELEAVNYCPNCGARMKGADDE